MPRVIECSDARAIGVEECSDGLNASGFDPRDEASLLDAARLLRQLSNNQTFLGDLLIDQLTARHRDDPQDSAYGPQAIMLSRPDGGDFFLRAAIWPSAQDHVVRASGDASFAYGLAHDHNFDFLTVGYFGPGYWSDYYDYDYEAVAGAVGEVAGLRFVERSRLSPGKLLHYRAHRDVHAQLPPDALSVSLNVMHASGAQGWLDQYAFDIPGNRIARVLSHSASEAFLRIAVGLGGEEAMTLAHHFARHHPSDRMRFHALDALAGAARSADERDEIWRMAEGMGSRMVALEAKARRAV